MSEIATAYKVAFQKELLADVAPELAGEIDRLEGVLQAVRVAVALSQQDIDVSRPHMYATKYIQGRVQGGDAALGRIKAALNGA